MVVAAGLAASVGKNQVAVPESASRFTNPEEAACADSVSGAKLRENFPAESAVAVATRVRGTSWPNVRACKTLSDGHAYRSMTASRTADPLVVVAAPDATTTVAGEADSACVIA
jgi:hypothetical protein